MSSNPALQAKDMYAPSHGSLANFVSYSLGSLEFVRFIISHGLLFGRQRSREWHARSKLDLTDTIKDGTRLFLIDEGIRRQLLLALTEDSKLHIQEV